MAVTVAQVTGWLATVRKALVAAGAVLAAVEAYGGTPTNVKAYVAVALAVLGTFGVTYKVTNKA